MLNIQHQSYSDYETQKSGLHVDCLVFLCAVDHREVCSTIQWLSAAWLSGISQFSAGRPAWRSQQVSGTLPLGQLEWHIDRVYTIGFSSRQVRMGSGDCEVIIIIIIAFKGAFRDFLQSPHSAVNCLQHIRSSGPGAIMCKLRATHRAFITCKLPVTCHLVRRDSSAIKFDRVEIAFIWGLFYWLNH